MKSAACKSHPIPSNNHRGVAVTPPRSHILRQIARAVVVGRLGPAAKVSPTPAASSGVPNGPLHVICVYTTDYRETAEVQRVRGELQVAWICSSVPLLHVFVNRLHTLSGIHARLSRRVQLVDKVF